MAIETHKQCMDRWYKDLPQWESFVPVALKDHVAALREREKEALSNCFTVTSEACRILLHEQTDAYAEWDLPLQQIKVYAGIGATHRFKQLIEKRNPPALFRAFWDLYMECMEPWFGNVFDGFLSIARSNASLLTEAPIAWTNQQCDLFRRSLPYYGWKWAVRACGKECSDGPEVDELLALAKREGEEDHFSLLQEVSQLPWLVAIDIHRPGNNADRKAWDRMSISETHSFLKHCESLHQSHLWAILRDKKQNALIAEAQIPVSQMNSTDQLNKPDAASNSAASSPLSGREMVTATEQRSPFPETLLENKLENVGKKRHGRRSRPEIEEERRKVAEAYVRLQSRTGLKGRPLSRAIGQELGLREDDVRNREREIKQKTLGNPQGPSTQAGH